MAKGYWNKRQGMIYYRYLDAIVRGVAADCTSMIDVGAHSTPLIERFDWAQERVALDIKKPYSSERVKGIQANFFDFKPEKPFDIAMCCQVLEHVPDAGAFAQHLFEVAKRVLISVPYLWPAGATDGHIHDPVDMEKLKSWTQRDPAYHLIVAEPFSRLKGVRLIAFYPAPGEKFSLVAARKKAAGLVPYRGKREGKSVKAANQEATV